MTDILTHGQLQEVLLEARHGLVAIFGDKLEKLWLYGSYARGEASPDSDIDVMALVNMSREELSTYRRQVSDFTSDIDLAHDVLLSVKLQDAETFWRFAEAQPFYANVLKEGIEIDAGIGKALERVGEEQAIMDASARILDKYREAYIALGGGISERHVFMAREERANGYKGRHAGDVLTDIDKILDGFSDDFLENGREQASLSQEEIDRGNFDI